MYDASPERAECAQFTYHVLTPSASADSRLYQHYNTDWVHEKRESLWDPRS